MPENPTLYAEDTNYFKTGNSTPDVWFDRTVAEIRDAGGRLHRSGYADEHESHAAAFMIDFSIGPNRYRIVWPVLPVRDKRNARAARIQAATALYHDVKAMAVRAKVFGWRSAALQWLLLPSGHTAAEASDAEVGGLFPPLLTRGDQVS